MTTERYQPPLLDKKNSRYDIVPPLGTKCPFDILFGLYKHKHTFMQRDLLYLWVERWSTEHFLITRNYAQNITFYQFFSIKIIVIQQKVSCFQIFSILYWQYKLISLRMRQLHFSLSYVGQVCIIKRPSSFIHVKISNSLLFFSPLVNSAHNIMLLYPPQRS